MEDYLCDGWTSSLDEDQFQLESVQQQPSSSFDNVSVSTTVNENIHKIWNSSNSLISQEYTCAASSQQLAPQCILSFENSTVQPSPNSELTKTTKKRTKNLRSSSQTQDHIISERKRRQVIGERFIALSATIPGLKKTDKASILQEAINYVKDLQETVKELENNSKRKRDSEKSQACTVEELLEVEARVIDKEILIGIHCEKQKNIVVKLMQLLQNLHLSIVSSSVMTFGSSTLKVTIIAQMDDEYCLSVNDLVNKLRQNLMESRDNQDNIS